MKKIFVALTICTLAGGCIPPSSSQPLVKVSWEQDGKNCLYKESFGEIRNEWLFGAFVDKEYINVVKTIEYGNTSCEKVIDAELKNNTNKSAITNQFH